jgi:hypothetical protein
MNRLRGPAAMAAAGLLAACGPPPAVAPGPARSAAECWDLSPAPGKTIETAHRTTAYAADGTPNARIDETESAVVGAEVAFEGHRATETLSTTSMDMTALPSGVTTRQTGRKRVYQRRSGERELTEYGQRSDDTLLQADGTSVRSEQRMVFVPPFVNRAPGMAVGETLPYTTSFTIHLSNDGRAMAPIPSTQSLNTRFVGIERVTVPAGTFETCRFEVFERPGAPVSTYWQLVGHGLWVRSAMPAEEGTGGSVREATLVRINGVVPP